MTVPLRNLDEPVMRHAHTDIMAIPARHTVQEVLDDIRIRPAATGSFFYLYVIDDDRRLAGVIQTRRLLTAPLDAHADSIMARNVIAIPETCTLLDACEFFVLHKFLAFPVVDADRRLLGVIDIGTFTEEMFDIEEREQVQNLFETLGVSLSEIRSPTAWSAFRYRFPWLLATIASGTVCALLAGLFEATLAQSLILAFFLTLVLGLGESVSMQAMAITVHALRRQTPRGGWYGQALVRELKRTFLLGLASALLVGCIAVLWQGHWPAGAVIGGGILVSLLLAGFLGVSVPALLHRLRLDLRVASGPVTLALADICTIGTYFSLAALFL